MFFREDRLRFFMMIISRCECVESVKYGIARFEMIVSSMNNIITIIIVFMFRFLFLF